MISYIISKSVHIFCVSKEEKTSENWSERKFFRTEGQIIYEKNAKTFFS